MDRYQRVEKKKPEAAINENEIRVTAQGRMRNYITYAMAKLEEEGPNEIVLKAMGRAINKTVMIAELIKRRIVGLHQNTSIESADITDTWEPLEEGLLPLETTRHVSVIVITLSKKELDASSSGYQSPLPPDQVKRLVEYDQGEELSPNVRGRGRGNRGSGRGRGRGRGRGNSNRVEDHGEYESWDDGRGYAGRGNGRGYRGRGRGHGSGRGYGGENGGGRGRGYGGENGGGYGRIEMHQESGEFESPPPRGRGNSNWVEDHGEYESWDAGRGYAGRGNGRGYRGRGRGRGRGYGGENGGGRGRRYGGENGGGYGRIEMHQESGEFEAPPPRGRGNNNGVEDHGGYESWDAGRGYDGSGNGHGYRGRGRGRGRGYGGENGRGRGRGYGGENGGGYGRTEMHQESGEFEAPPPRGRGRGSGMARGSGRGQNYRSYGSGPARANA